MKKMTIIATFILQTLLIATTLKTMDNRHNAAREQYLALLEQKEQEKQDQIFAKMLYDQELELAKHKTEKHRPLPYAPTNTTVPTKTKENNGHNAARDKYLALPEQKEQEKQDAKYAKMLHYRELELARHKTQNHHIRHSVPTNTTVQTKNVKPTTSAKSKKAALLRSCNRPFRKTANKPKRFGRKKVAINKVPQNVRIANFKPGNITIAKELAQKGVTQPLVIRQGAGECGSYAILNAYAIQSLAEQNKPINSANIQQLTKNKQYEVIHRQLEQPDVVNFINKTGLKRTLVMAHNRENGNFYIGAQTPDLGEVAANLELFFTHIMKYLEIIGANDFHFLCNTGGHWISISVVIKPGSKKIYFCNSSNAALVTQKNNSYLFVKFIVDMLSNL